MHTKILYISSVLGILIHTVAKEAIKPFLRCF